MTKERLKTIRSSKGLQGAPVVDVSGRRIDSKERLLLWVRAGGRCEFDGCNAYQLAHPLTQTSGVFGQAAHIVAFKLGGPRGRDQSRPASINDAANLMLLCPQCHKLIDDHPERYPVEALKEYKRRHESRIFQLTELGPEGRTAVLILLAPIRGQSVSVPFNHVVGATAPRYPSTLQPTVIDLRAVSDIGPAFLRAARDTIRQDTKDFFGKNGEASEVGHVSVFALGPIPLLTYLGRQMTSKIPVDFYQRHRDTENWSWKTGRSIAKFSVRRARRGTRRGKVALILSLSGAIQLRDLPKAIRKDLSVYQITLSGQAPRTTFLRTRRDLEAFRIAYQEALGMIMRENGHIDAIELFPAVPAPIAVLCGRELLPKVHPRLRIWDFDHAKGGFTYQTEV